MWSWHLLQWNDLKPSATSRNPRTGVRRGTKGSVEKKLPELGIKEEKWSQFDWCYNNMKRWIGEGVYADHSKQDKWKIYQLVLDEREPKGGGEGRHQRVERVYTGVEWILSRFLGLNSFSCWADFVFEPSLNCNPMKGFENRKCDHLRVFEEWDWIIWKSCRRRSRHLGRLR